MKSLRVLLAVLISSTFLFTPIKAQKIYNRYGMVLNKEGEGSYTIKDAKAYEALIGDPYLLPKALVPYDAKVPAYSKAAMKKVDAETIVYKKSVTGDDLPMMVYRSGRSNSPVVFLIHGGGWVSGSYKGAETFCKTLAGKYGITVVSIEYSFANAPGVRLEDTVGDCYDAVNYVLSRAQEFGIDPQRVGFVGSSAGGHLSACCAMHFPQTKAYAGWYGAYDLQYTMDNLHRQVFTRQNGRIQERSFIQGDAVHRNGRHYYRHGQRPPLPRSPRQGRHQGYQDCDL